MGKGLRDAAIKKEKSDKPRKPHRFRPGTRALLNMRREQKKTNLNISKADINRIIRDAITETSYDTKVDGLRVSAHARRLIHEMVEEREIKLMHMAQLNAFDNGRLRANPNDVRFVQAFCKLP